MSNSYVLLEKIVVPAAGASSVTFANIPQTGYTDLVIKYSARVDASGNYQSMAMAFNGGSPASAFTQRWINGNGISAASGSYGANTTLYPSYVNAASSTSSTFGNGEIYIPNYSSTSQYKSVSVDAITETNATDARSELDAMLWSSNNAVTSITLYGNTNFVANSTFYLYGVAKLGTTPTIAPKATGGDVIMTDGTYWYHAFRASGTFTPAVGLTCDMLVVGGGAGGGSGHAGGGGGAGGLSAFTSQSVSSAITVTVGAGGSAANNGTSSQFGSLSAAIGGGAGGSEGIAPSSGASGGGASGDPSSSYNTGASGTAGNNGGNGSGSSGNYGNGGGGGGVGAVGQAASGQGINNAGYGGTGGNGTSTYSSWGSITSTGQNISGTYWYASGGGGGYWGSGNQSGAGGSGGGGKGGYGTASPVAPIAGTANTGGGGGGSRGDNSVSPSTRVGAAGGSGLVIVRYLVA